MKLGSFFGLLVIFAMILGMKMQSLKKGDLCADRKSVCMSVQDCPSAMLSIDRGEFPPLCSFDRGVAIICCSEVHKTVPIIDDRVIFPGPTNETVAAKSCKKYRSQVCTNRTSYSSLNWNTRPKSVIVGGLEAQPKQFPHMALVGFGSNYNDVKWACGGSLISERYVLSAAHCSNTFNGVARWVRLGELDLESSDDDAKPSDYEIIARIVHPEYKPPAVYHDVALFQLNRVVEFNDYVRPICLHHKTGVLNQNLIASGWGALGYGEITNNIMMYVTLNVVGPDDCSRLYPKDQYLPRGLDAESQICAGYLEGLKDTCQGDSGGPLQYLTMIENCPLLYTQVGIVSFGRGCAFKESPGIYTRVSYYIRWIESVVWK